jgi:hypothetical protein
MSRDMTVVMATLQLQDSRDQPLTPEAATPRTKKHWKTMKMMATGAMVRIEPAIITG